MKRIVIWIFVACVLLLLFIGSELYVVSRSNPNSRIVSSFPWPIACSLRGCITSKDWALQRSYDTAFAQKTSKMIPSESSTLTTILRRHLISHANLQSSITPQDAVKYRTAILHTTDIATIRPLGMSSFDQYDTTIILPFLQQEALMKQNNIPDTEILYKNLAHQRPIFLLLFHYHWNTDRGEVE
ncbi:MAG TPA: hypothetical protein VLG69_02055 [Candidatus Andersenbacteria bacterium]|nr:hypothetical protein [Candidatus Andersenbacteria bacterium]